MRAAYAALIAAWFGAAAAAQDAPPAFVEVELPAGPVWAGQCVDMVVRIGYDETFFREFGVPLLQRRLDLPFQLVVPWFDERPDPRVDTGAVVYRHLAVGDREVKAAQQGTLERGGRTFELLDLVWCPWTAQLPGEHVLEPVLLRYAYATRFEESLLGGRQPVDRHDATAASAPQRIVVRALPAGAPREFSGAVGTFDVQAEAWPREVEFGDTFTLQLEVSRGDNLLSFPPPPWPELPGFVVQGLLEQRSKRERRFLFDVLAVRVGAEIGPLGFCYFDPVAGEYRTARTAPVPLLVVPLPAGREVSPRVQALLDADAAAVAQERAVPWPYHAGLVAAVVVLLAGARRWRRRLRRRAEHERGLTDLAHQLQAGPDAACAAFEACCAAWAGSGGVPEPLMARARAIQDALAAARYGGKPPAADEVLDLARQIVSALR